METGYEKLLTGRGLFRLCSATVMAKAPLPEDKYFYPIGVGFGFTHESAVEAAKQNFREQWPSISLEDPTTYKVGLPQTQDLWDDGKKEDVFHSHCGMVRRILAIHGHNLDVGELAQVEEMLAKHNYASALRQIQAITLENALRRMVDSEEE